MSNDTKLTRREALERTLAIGALIPASWLLGGCGGGAAALSCETDADKAQREQMKYVAKTTNPQQRCDNCAQWVAAAAAGQCGTCKVVKGQIHPEGYCMVWAKKA